MNSSRRGYSRRWYYLARRNANSHRTVRRSFGEILEKRVLLSGASLYSLTASPASAPHQPIGGVIGSSTGTSNDGETTTYNLSSGAISIDPAQALGAANNAFNAGHSSSIPLGAALPNGPIAAQIAAPQIAGIGGSLSPNQVIGADDRIQVGRGNMTTFPWSTIGRVWVLWKDGTQASGTGAMVNERTMLTTGDLLYSSTHGGFAAEVVFSPGQDGAALLDPFLNTSFARSEYQPYGEVFGTQVTVFNNWINNADLDSDIGFVTLDRNIGNYTGWLGYGYNNNDSAFQGVIANNAGYPAELVPGNYDMFYSSGTIQTVNPGNFQSQIDVTAGESGSPLWLYTPANGNQIIYGVAAAGSATFNQFARITQSVFTSLQTTISNAGAATDLPDLVDYDSWFNANLAYITPKSLSTGDAFSAAAPIFNEGTAAATNFSVSFYASSDTTLSNDDVLLGTANVSSLAALSSAYVTAQGTMPALASGNYHLVWAISSSQSQLDGFYKTGASASTFAVGNGSISGVVYNDANQNGVKDANEQGLANWTVYLDTNNNGALDPGETSTVSQSDGSYTFSHLALGTYHVRQVLQPNWTQSQPSPTTSQVVVADDIPQLVQSGVIPKMSPDFKLRLGSDGAPLVSTTPQGLTPAQIRKAYGFDQIAFGSTQGTGAGQTIAIVDAYDSPTIVNDLHKFDQAFGIADPTSFVRVAQDGSTNYPSVDPHPPGGPLGTWEEETSLDVEWAHALAPKANILLVEANSPNDLFTAVDFARKQPGVSVVSMSFGGPEFQQENQVDGIFNTPIGHTGVTFVASTGDTGSPGGYPAYSPNVLAIGGTTLTVDTSGTYQGETGWGYINSSGKFEGSGGGISQLETQPVYQQGVVTQSNTRRTIPDVSLDADPATGPAIYDSYDFGTKPWTPIGGTSFSAPAWSALIAIANQGRAVNSLASMDGPTETLPAVYALPSSDFHDVTTGNNSGFQAGTGYDLVTGRGTPKANLVALALAGAPTASFPGGYTVQVIASATTVSGKNFGNFGKPGIQVQGNGIVITNHDTTPSTTDDTEFGIVTVGISLTETFTVTNVGFATLNLSSVKTTSKSDFAITAAPASSIAPGASTTFSVAFFPSTSGLRTSTVTIADNDALNNPFTFLVEGTGVKLPVVALSGHGQAIANNESTPSVVNGTDFGAVRDDAVQDVTFTITNSGKADLVLSGTPLVQSSDPADFSIIKPLKSATIKAGKTGTFTLEFHPVGVGLETANIEFFNNDATKNPFIFLVQGTGVGVPQISVSGNGIIIANKDSKPSLTDGTNFGNAVVGGAPVVETFTVKNNGNANLTLGQLTANKQSDFVVLSQPASLLLLPNDTTTFQIQFNPTKTGTRTAKLTLTNSDIHNSPFTFSIQGAGVKVSSNATPQVFTALAAVQPSGNSSAANNSKPAVAAAATASTGSPSTGTAAKPASTAAPPPSDAQLAAATDTVFGSAHDVDALLSNDDSLASLRDIATVSKAIS
jgi:V8-like Glu-specific endopeptidase